jgi:hypothetical protein
MGQSGGYIIECDVNMGRFGFKLKKSLFVLFLFLPSVSFAGITHVQQCTDTAKYTGASSPPDSCTFPVAVTAGNTIIVTCQWGDSITSVPSATDNKGDTFLEATNTNQYFGTQGIDIFYFPNAPSGVTSVTCNYSGVPDFLSVMAHEYSGLAKSNVLDISTGTSGTTSSINYSALVGPMTTTVNGDLIYVVLEDATNAFTPTAGTNSLNYALKADLSSSADIADEDAIQTLAGAVTGSMTDSNNGDDYSISMAAFKPLISSQQKVYINNAKINKARIGF